MSSSAMEKFRPPFDYLISADSLLYDKESDEKIKKERIRWEYKAYAITPDSDIAHNIAIHFMNLPNKDCSSAIQWLTKATSGENANLFSQNYLGELYETGNCVPQDYVMAYMMYDLGGTAAAEEKHALAKKMSQEQINEGLRRSHQWQDDNQSYRPGYGDWGGSEIHWNVHED